MSMNIIFDYGNVLVRWSPETVFKPYFNDDAKYWFFGAMCATRTSATA